MGSGGLRGLQILRSGALRVRGGFDSHAFPPFAVLAVALSLALPQAAGAQAAQSSPGPAVTEGARVDSAAADTTARANEDAVRPPREPRTIPTRQLERFDQPRWVMLRSLVLPGWGQVHNRAWLKALGVVAGEVSLGLGIRNDERELDRLSAAADAAQEANDEDAFLAAVSAYNVRLDSSIRRRWLLGALLAYALLDAYVDAHFRHFDVEFDTDPPLPGGAPPAGGKLSMRWTF